MKKVIILAHTDILAYKIAEELCMKNAEIVINKSFEPEANIYINTKIPFLNESNDFEYISFQKQGSKFHK